jgi:membrane protein
MARVLDASRAVAPRRSGFVLARELLRAVRRARTFGLAAEMSFWLLLALVPLAAVTGFVAARMAVAYADVTPALFEGAPEPVRAFLSAQVEAVARWHGGTVAPIALAIFVWLAASGIHAVFDALEVQAGASRSWLKKRALALVTCVALSIGIAALLAAMGAVAWVARALAGAALSLALSPTIVGTLSRITAIIAGAALSFVLLCVLYRIGTPRTTRGRARVAPGAALAALLHLVLGTAYSAYVSHVGLKGAYQAGLAVIGATMMTLYLFAIAVLAGAALNAALVATRPGVQ